MRRVNNSKTYRARKEDRYFGIDRYHKLMKDRISCGCNIYYGEGGTKVGLLGVINKFYKRYVYEKRLQKM